MSVAVLNHCCVYYCIIETDGVNWNAIFTSIATVTVGRRGRKIGQITANSKNPDKKRYYNYKATHSSSKIQELLTVVLQLKKKKKKIKLF